MTRTNPGSEAARFWAMVAAFGALWGALEITLGSFLHALRMPFGGTALAVVAAALLVAQRQVLPRRGLSLATGVVAALCKSVSPGGVILGPMIAITAEALLVELALLPAPRSRLAAAWAGALVVCWAMFQKVIAQYVYLGGDVIDLYVALLEQGARTAGLSPAAGWRVVGLLIGLVAVTGAAIALHGHHLGRRVSRLAPGAPEPERPDGAASAARPPSGDIGSASEHRAAGTPDTRPWVRLLTRVLAFCCIALQFGQRLDLAALALAIWLITLAMVDRGALRRLRMPKFWTFLIAVALLSGLFLGPRDLELAGLRLSAQGLEAGALMVLRGAFLFGLTSWAARNLDGRLARRLAARVGLGSLALAVTTAFGVLPALMDRLGWSKRDAPAVWRARWAARGQMAVESMAEAVRLAERLTADFAARSRVAWVAVEGPPGSGKTTSIERLVASLRATGLAVGGVIQPALEGEGRREGYDVLDLSRGDRRSLARRKPGEQRFEFDSVAWRWAGERLAESRERDDVVVIDELGRLEARGEGHLAALRSVSQRSGKAVVLLAAVREGCLDPLAGELGAPVLRLRAPLGPEDIEKATLRLEVVIKDAPRGS